MSGRQARESGIYWSPEWRMLRAKLITAAGWRCSVCKRTRADLEIDHIIPMARGGAALDERNLSVKCADCHREKTRRENGNPVSPERAAWRELAKKEVGNVAE